LLLIYKVNDTNQTTHINYNIRILLFSNNRCKDTTFLRHTQEICRFSIIYSHFYDKVHKMQP
jgi:hypothetical protein